MKYFIMLGLFSFLLAPKTLDAQIKSIYDFKVAGLDGGEIDLAAYKGKKILIVNTASKCGYTSQYEGLEKLYEANKGKLVVIGFPANNFLYQEPGKFKSLKVIDSMYFAEYVSFAVFRR